MACGLEQRGPRFILALLAGASPIGIVELMIWAVSSFYSWHKPRPTTTQIAT